MLRPAPGLSPDIAAALKEVMPGAGEFLSERYEYAKHGACFGFDPNAYFGTMIRLDKAIKTARWGSFWRIITAKPLAALSLIASSHKCGAG